MKLLIQQNELYKTGRALGLTLHTSACAFRDSDRLGRRFFARIGDRRIRVTGFLNVMMLSHRMLSLASA